MTKGTGVAGRLVSMPCAGKTGTTNDSKDLWFVGFTKYYTTSVWVGYDIPRSLTGLSYSATPLGIWKIYMESLHQGLEVKPLDDYKIVTTPVEDNSEEDEKKSEEEKRLEEEKKKAEEEKKLEEERRKAEEETTSEDDTDNVDDEGENPEDGTDTETPPSDDGTGTVDTGGGTTDEGNAPTDTPTETPTESEDGTAETP